MRIRHAWFALALPLTAACSEHTDPQPAVAADTVSVQDNLFSPAQVTAAPGEAIAWEWAGANLHNVTFGDGPASATQSSGGYTRPFAPAGTYPYQCTVHGASMSGSVVIQ